jgi:hypothetical protein
MHGASLCRDHTRRLLLKSLAMRYTRYAHDTSKIMERKNMTRIHAILMLLALSVLNNGCTRSSFFIGFATYTGVSAAICVIPRKEKLMSVVR